MELDLLGFQRTEKHHSFSKQCEFEQFYHPIAESTQRKWDNIFAYSQVPAKSDSMKHLIRKGIPLSYRANCWFKYSGGEKLLHENEGLYDILSYRESQDLHTGHSRKSNKIHEFIEIIDRDLFRTFPENNKFMKYCPNLSRSGSTSSNETIIDSEKIDYSKETRHIQSLRRILIAFAYYSYPHPDPSRTLSRRCTYTIGYCQSLNFIVGLLLLVFSFDTDFEHNQDTSLDIETRVFWTLVALIELVLPHEMYGESLEGAQITQQVLWMKLVSLKSDKFGIEKVSRWIDNMNSHSDSACNIGSSAPPMETITMQWSLSLFINVFPLETVMRIWDCLFYQGFDKIFSRVVLTMLKFNQDRIVSLDEGIKVWKYFKESPKDMINCHDFMDMVFQKKMTAFDLLLRRSFVTGNDVKAFRGVGSISQQMIDGYRQEIISERIEMQYSE